MSFCVLDRNTCCVMVDVNQEVNNYGKVVETNAMCASTNHASCCTNLLYQSSDFADGHRIFRPHR